jgi:hypothetical protein
MSGVMVKPQLEIFAAASAAVLPMTAAGLFIVKPSPAPSRPPRGC